MKHVLFQFCVQLTCFLFHFFHKIEVDGIKVISENFSELKIEVGAMKEFKAMQLVLCLLHLPTPKDEDASVVDFMLLHRNRENNENIIRTAFVGGSVYVICSTIDDDIMRPLVIEGRTFMVDKKNVIDEVDNEDCHGDLVQELCFNDTSLRVDSFVTSIALKYIKKRCSGFRKDGRPCGNYVRDPLLRCRWHVERNIFS